MQYLGQIELRDALLDWLTRLDAPKLTRVLASRPETLRAPWPRRLEDVAKRLSDPYAELAATRRLLEPRLQLLCAVQVCEGLGHENGVPLAAAAGWLGCSEAAVADGMAGLSDFALGYVHDGMIRLLGDVNAHAYARYGLGHPLARIFANLTAQHLTAICLSIGLPVARRKQQIIFELLEFFRDGDLVRQVVAGAPDGVAELLAEFVITPDHQVDLGISFGYPRREMAETPAAWAVKRGLLMTGQDGNAHMPLEIGLALRGPAYRLPFTPEQPVVAIAPVAPERVTAEASAAALRLLDRTTTVIESVAAEPVQLLKDGRLGARVIAKMAKATGASTDEIRLVFELALSAGLLAVEEPPPPLPATGRRSRKPGPVPPPCLLPAGGFTRWRAEGAAAQLRTLLIAWWLLPSAPLGDEKAIRAIYGDGPDELFSDVRQLTMRSLTELDGAVADVAAFISRVAWHAPFYEPEILRTVVTSSLAEAALVGAAASAAASDLAQALVDDGPDSAAFVKATEELVAGALASALFGTDLTAVVTGPPSTDLASLLDRVADRETQGSASTWRFSPASVRRAYDNGETAAGLLKELGVVATGELPQPLTYLLNDVARRHGEVGVVAVGSVVIGEEAALLAEIAAHRKLAKLELRLIAPTVLTSSADAATTLAALRDAGFAPMHRAADGTVVLPGAGSAVAAGSTVSGGDAAQAPAWEPETSVEDPDVHAERLLRAPASGPGPLRRGALLNALPGSRSQKWMRQVWQLETGMPVEITYAETDGETSKLLVTAPELDGDAIDVWVAGAGRYRRLELSRIVTG